MINLLAGLTASILSLLLNKFFVFKFGDKVIIYLIPLAEELFKTGTAHLLGANLIFTHLIFGILEAIFDSLSSNNLAAWLAVLTHLLLGILTYYIWRSSNNLVSAVIVVVLVHTGWNYYIRRYNREINL